MDMFYNTITYLFQKNKCVETISTDAVKITASKAAWYLPNAQLSLSLEELSDFALKHCVFSCFRLCADHPFSESDHIPLLNYILQNILLVPAD